MSWLSDVVSNPVKTIMNPFQGIFNDVTGIGSKPGIPNAYGPPDLSFLRQNPFPTSRSINLTGQYRPVGGTSEALFQDLLKNINAPSSVGQVEKGLQGQQLQELMKGIDTSTRQGVGSLKSDFQERGLGGPGQLSDIESSGLGQLYGQGNQSKTNAMLDYQLKDLERQKAREAAATGAYGERYKTGTAADVTNSQMFNELLGKQAEMTQQAELGFGQLKNQRDIELAKALANLYTGGQETNAATQQPGYLDSFLRNISLGISL